MRRTICCSNAVLYGQAYVSRNSCSPSIVVYNVGIDKTKCTWETCWRVSGLGRYTMLSISESASMAKKSHSVICGPRMPPHFFPVHVPKCFPSLAHPPPTLFFLSFFVCYRKTHSGNSNGWWPNQNNRTKINALKMPGRLKTTGHPRKQERPRPPRKIQCQVARQKDIEQR